MPHLQAIVDIGVGEIDSGRFLDQKIDASPS
jgi:hypothetical protein